MSLDNKSSVIGNLDIVELSYNKFNVIDQKSRKVRIWTPKNYNKNDNKRYPVIYLQDGQNIFDVKTAVFGVEWQADETMTSLINKDFNGAIIVGIDNTSERLNEYLYNHPFINFEDDENSGNIYMDFVVEIVKPYVDNNYKTLTNRNNTTIGGSSFGGMIALFGGLEHLDTFGNILVFSASTWTVTFNEFANYFINKDFSNYLDSKFFFYVGTNQDGNTKWPEKYEKLFKEKGFNKIKVHYGIGDKHDEKAWAKHLPIALKWLYDLE